MRGTRPNSVLSSFGRWNAATPDGASSWIVGGVLGGALMKRLCPVVASSTLIAVLIPPGAPLSLGRSDSDVSSPKKPPQSR